VCEVLKVFLKGLIECSFYQGKRLGKQLVGLEFQRGPNLITSDGTLGQNMKFLSNCLKLKTYDREKCLRALGWEPMF
jgi:hypothetical protein